MAVCKFITSAFRWCLGDFQIELMAVNLYLFLSWKAIIQYIQSFFVAALLVLSHFQFLRLFLSWCFSTHSLLRSREINMDLLISLPDKLWFVHQHHLKCYDYFWEYDRKKAWGRGNWMKFLWVALCKTKGIYKTYNCDFMSQWVLASTVMFIECFCCWRWASIPQSTIFFSPCSDSWNDHLVFITCKPAACPSKESHMCFDSVSFYLRIKIDVEGDLWDDLLRR